MFVTVRAATARLIRFIWRDVARGTAPYDYHRILEQLYAILDAVDELEDTWLTIRT